MDFCIDQLNNIIILEQELRMIVASSSGFSQFEIRCSTQNIVKPRGTWELYRLLSNASNQSDVAAWVGGTTKLTSDSVLLQMLKSSMLIVIIRNAEMNYAMCNP